MSPGATDHDTNSGIDCGTVRNANISWVSDHGFIIRGADADGIVTRLGDSGSPIYRTTNVAVGIHNTSTGGFAKLADALAATGATMYR